MLGRTAGLGFASERSAPFPRNFISGQRRLRVYSGSGRALAYATVHQMVSRVTGRLVPGTSLARVLAALFPCGSVTGAPKLRAMEIIRELEPWPRDAYCGAIGWAAPDGRAAFNVAIRTLTLHPDGAAVLNVGGGVVADSTAESEYEEALWKARFADPFPPT